MTTLSRVGSVTLLNNTMGDVGKLQEQLATLQEQISSGIKAKNFQQLNGQVEQFTLMESRIRRTEAYIETNQLAIARMQTADQSLSQVVEIADQMEDLIVAARNPANAGSLAFEQQMKNLLHAMATALNVSFDGRYLFSGTASNQPPMPDTTVTPTLVGTPDAGYYKGSGTNVQLRAEDTLTYDFPVRADDIAFQKIYAAAHQAIEGYRYGDDAQLKQALELMQSGQDDLNTARSRVNMTIINITDVNERLGAMNLYWKGVTEKIGKTDIVAATTQIASYEAVLQATFQVYARLSQLRLSDYL